MKRLLVVTLLIAAVLSIGLGAWAASDTGVKGATDDKGTLSPSASWHVGTFIVLIIPDADMTITLEDATGQVDAGGNLLPLTETNTNANQNNHSARVITNDTSGYDLVVSASSNTAILSEFQIKVGVDGNWIAFNDTGDGITIASSNGPADDTISGIAYRYAVSTSDAPGDYSVTLTYTATPQ